MFPLLWFFLSPSLEIRNPDFARVFFLQLRSAPQRYDGHFCIFHGAPLFLHGFHFSFYRNDCQAMHFSLFPRKEEHGWSVYPFPRENPSLSGTRCIVADAPSKRGEEGLRGIKFQTLTRGMILQPRRMDSLFTQARRLNSFASTKAQNDVDKQKRETTAWACSSPPFFSLTVILLASLRSSCTTYSE